MNKQEKAKAQKKLDTILHEAKKLKEIIDAPDTGRWKPAVNEIYSYITSAGETGGTYNGKSFYDIEKISIGNCYKTRDKAQAVVDLKKHIYSFELPEHGGKYYNIGRNNEMADMGRCFANELYQLADYYAGTLINGNATKEERKERIKLLKKVCDE